MNNLLLEQSKKELTSEKNIYKALDFYMIRTPMYPTTLYTSLFSEETQTMDEMINKLIYLSKDPTIREIIGTASQSLLDELLKIESIDNPQKMKKVLSSFIRYIIRMSTRATPFGLFAGVDIGTWEENTHTSLDNQSKFKKRLRVDMEWLLKFIQTLENDLSIIQKLNVSLNSMCLPSGSRVYIPYLTGYGQKSFTSMEMVSFKFNEPLQFVMENTLRPIKFGKLEKLLYEKYPGFDQQQIQNFLLELFKNELLISELRPPLLSTYPSPFEYILQKLSKLDKVGTFLESLTSINEKIETYNNLPIGEGSILYKDLHNSMQRIEKTKNPLQVDLRIKTLDATLSIPIKEQVEKAADLIWNLSSVESFPHLNSYKVDFIEKYGTYCEVPLLELLDEDKGLGPPATYEFPPSSKRDNSHQSKSLTNREQYLMQLINESLRTNTNEISLDEEMIQKLSNPEISKSEYPLSFDIYFSIHAENKNEIDEGKFKLILGANPSSNRAGQTFGRFLDLFDEDFLPAFKDIAHLEEDLCPDVIFAEVSLLSNKGRALNVVLTESIRSKEITLGTNPSNGFDNNLRLDDLVVGCTGQRMYLKSISLNNEIIPTTGHMLNYQGSPNVYRFLIEIGLMNGQTWRPFNWGILESAPFLPRLRYENIILSSARWKIDQSTSPFNQEEMTYEQWLIQFKQWKKTNDVPKFVYLTYIDNRLVLNLDFSMHLQELYTEFKKLKDGHSILLTETIDLFDSCWLDSEQGNYTLECVFPLIKNQLNPLIKENNDVAFIKNQKMIVNKNKTFTPGSEWLYLKFYLNSKREEEFIGSELRKFYNLTKEKGVFEHFFYMRYRDPDNHIRLRFKGTPHILLTQLLPLINDWVQELGVNGILNHFVIDTYTRETERYGGPDLIDIAESVFHLDSILCCEWIGQKRNGHLDLDIDLIATISTIDILNNFGLNLYEKLHLLNSTVSYKESLKKFRLERNNYINYANPYDNWSELKKYNKSEILLTYLEMRKPKLIEYSNKVNKLNQSLELYNQKDDIILSVVHLHLNRLLGINREKEKKILALARHTLHNLRYKYGAV